MSLLAVALLLGGALVQLVVLSIAENGHVSPLPHSSAERQGEGLCRQVAVERADVVTAAGRRALAQELSTTATAFAVLAADTVHDAVVGRLARDWSDVAISWSAYASDPVSAKLDGARRAMSALDGAARSGGWGECAVFQVPLARGVLS